jgi:signal transduction histidine kinase
MKPIEIQAPAPGSGDARIERQLVELSWERYGASALIAPAVALALALLAYSHVEPIGFVVWCLWAAGAYAMRSVMFRRWRRSRARGVDPRCSRRSLLLVHAATALIWGGGALLFIGQLDPLRLALVAIIVCGVAAASAQASPFLRSVLYVNLSLELLPLALVAFLQGTTLFAMMGCLTLIYGLYLLHGGLEQNRWLSHHLALQAQNAALLDQMQGALLRANAASDAKTQFLANMSHELRTPLNAILGFADMMATLPDNRLSRSKVREYSRVILESGRHLLALISDLLDLTKAESGKLELTEETCDLSAMIGGCLDHMAPIARKNGIDLVLDPAGAESFVVRGDERKLRQIMLNLLSNAIKFTPDGGTVRVTLKTPAGGGVIVAVADTGIGMTTSEVIEALEPFAQISNTYTRQHQGTGLGLPLTKRLVDLHGGRMTIESEPGKGTTISIRLPRGRRLEGAPDPALHRAAGG